MVGHQWEKNCAHRYTQIRVSQEPCRVSRSPEEAGAGAGGQRRMWAKVQDKGAGEGQGEV